MAHTQLREGVALGDAEVDLAQVGHHLRLEPERGGHRGGGGHRARHRGAHQDVEVLATGPVGERVGLGEAGVVERDVADARVAVLGVPDRPAVPHEGEVGAHEAVPPAVSEFRKATLLSCMALNVALPTFGSSHPRSSSASTNRA